MSPSFQFLWLTTSYDLLCVSSAYAREPLAAYFNLWESAAALSLLMPQRRK